MKICMICPEIGEAGTLAFIGGHVNNVVRISKYLSERGHEITIVTTPHRHSRGPNLIDFAEIHTLPIYEPYMTVKYSLKYLTLAPLKVKALSKQKNFDIIHGHSGYIAPSIITILSTKMTNVPSVHSIYCPVEKKSKTKNVASVVSEKLSGSLGKLMLMQLDKVISVTENIKKSIYNIGVPYEKIETVPLTIDTQKFNSKVKGEEIKERFGINSETTLVYVGNLSKIKGLHVLIESLKIVKEEINDFKLLMVLNLPISKYMNPDRFEVDMEAINIIKDKIKKYGLEDNIIPIGLTEELNKIMAAGDIFVTPFLGITGIADYPLSLLEAMALAKPPIATKIGGIPEIIEHGRTGLLIKPGDEKELAENILYLANNPKKAEKIGKNASKYVISNFSPEIVTKKLEKIYEEVIEGK